MVSRKQKLLKKLRSRPRDFTLAELVALLTAIGYRQLNAGKTSGSRARFVHEEYPAILLHKPHLRPVLKLYQIDGVLELLKQEKLL